MNNSKAYRVLKFGGSSVANATAMSGVLDIVEKEAEQGTVILVSSAISGCTDALLGGDTAALQEMVKRHHNIVKRLFTGSQRDDVLEKVDGLFAQMYAAPEDEKVTFGELLSTTILEAKLASEGYAVKWLDSRELVVKTNEEETFRRIAEAIEECPGAELFVAPGFICREAAGKISTLGRGGSDYSAALFAAAVKAESLQIWTDVPGIMTANPKQVPSARTIPRMSYKAALDMASHGAKVLYAPTVAPAMETGIDIEIRNTFAPAGQFTVIGAEADAPGWIGIASDGDTIRIVGSGVSVEDGLRTAQGALKRAQIGAVSMTEEDGGITLTVRHAVLENALLTLHKAFFQILPAQIVHLFVAGDGAVAGALRQMIKRTAGNVKERTGKVLWIAGRANSRKYGIRLDGEPSIGVEGDFVDAVIKNAPKGSLFIDATNSHTLYKRYVQLLEAGIGIVSSNRRSLAVPMEDYRAMQAAARENGVPFRYETTVGAALPMLGSIAQGANSLDKIVSIEAVVSCTMNQILGDYKPGDSTFASLLLRAQKAGLTEKDPRKDLGGMDALRKLLILSREAGVELEEQDVEVLPLVPSALLECSVEAFYKGLESHEPQFAELYSDAAAKGCRLRFVATLEKAAKGYRASIGIREVAPEHPAFNLKGTENAIIVSSALHPYPLVIQGPGEGAQEAASSILNDILR